MVFMRLIGVWIYFSASSNALSLNPDGSAVNPGAFQLQIRNDSNAMSQLFQVRWCSFSSVCFSAFG